MNKTLVVACLAVMMPLTYAASAAAKAGPIPPRDWTKAPAIVEVTTTQDIWAVGDAHADPQRFGTVLAGAGLIQSVPSNPGTVKWTGGKSVLVMTGDMVDKWKNSIGIIQMMQALQASATAAGGQVIITMGNHETEFMKDPTGKKTAEFAGELTKAGLEPADVAACKGSIGAFLCGLPFGAKVNDYFFCHAGNTGGASIADLSASIQKGYAKNGYGAKELIGDNSLIEARLNKQGPNGLPWFDNGSKKTNPQTLVSGYAQALGVKHLVQGHQPGKVKFPDKTARAAGQLFQRYGLLFLIDGGMSQGVNNSQGGVLHLTSSGTGETVTAVCFDGSKTVLWNDATNQNTGAVLCGHGTGKKDE